MIIFNYILIPIDFLTHQKKFKIKIIKNIYEKNSIYVCNTNDVLLALKILTNKIGLLYVTTCFDRSHYNVFRLRVFCRNGDNNN